VHDIVYLRCSERMRGAHQQDARRLGRHGESFKWRRLLHTCTIHIDMGVDHGGNWATSPSPEFGVGDDNGNFPADFVI